MIRFNQNGNGLYMIGLRVNTLRSDVYPAPAKSKNLPPTANSVTERSNLMTALCLGVGVNHKRSSRKDCLRSKGPDVMSGIG